MNWTECTLAIEDGAYCLKSTIYPFYYIPRPYLIDGISDNVVTLGAPIVAYWSLSLFFHCLDMSGWTWLETYKIHESAEVKTRNQATRSQVVLAVILQQVIQTLLGIVWLAEDAHKSDPLQDMQGIISTLQPIVWRVIGERIGRTILPDVTRFVYWWGIPVLQFFAAMFLIDTWQYFLHRLMHVNKFLFKHFHSWHHRLYVPYAFGSLYNHPVEGFLLDSLGAVVAEWLTGMTTRQAMILFSISTLKTVDDHCGYTFPYDPLQMITRNNADYHDIHHQVIGIKSNFAQPFFVHWDALLGTRMTRRDIELRREKYNKKM